MYDFYGSLHQEVQIESHEVSTFSFIFSSVHAANELIPEAATES